MASEKEVRPSSGHEDWVGSVTYSPDGKTVATGGGDRTIRIWNLATARELRQLHGCDGDVDSVAFSPDGRLLASGSRDGIIRLWDASGTKMPTSIRGHSREVVVAFFPDGRKLASAGRDGHVQLWDLATMKRIWVSSFPEDGFLCLGVSPDARLLVSAGLDEHKRGMKCALRVIEAQTGRELCQLVGHQATISAVAFSPDNRFIASGSWDHTVRLWELATRKELVWMATSGSIRSIAFSPAGETLAATGFDNSVLLYETLTGKERCRLEGHHGGVIASAFAPNGATLATGSMDTTVLIWDVRGDCEPPHATEVSEKELDHLWTALAQNDAARAYQAISRLSKAPGQTVPYLRRQLWRPRIDTMRLAMLLRDLGDHSIDTREHASAALESLGEVATSFLKESLKGELSPEVRRRAERILEKAAIPLSKPVSVRQMRVVEILERIGTREALQVLEDLAKTRPEDPIKDEAGAAVRRLIASQVARP
jgi:WD40 repeat protein